MLIAATTVVPLNSLNALQPWDLQASLVAYNGSYLAGFKAQRSQVSLQDGFTQAKNVMATTIQGDVRQAIGGDEQRIHSITTQHNAVTFKHILLPV